MDAHLIDSAIYGDNWSTAFSREVFSERSRLERWLHVISALARAQASVGIIPAESALAISMLDVADIDIRRVAEGTRETSHSTLGLIHELQRLLPASSREHVYVGTTVQDITDTAASLEVARIGQQVWADLWEIERLLIDLAREHRETPMTGRTHGQPGAPITFGFKAASWLDEVGRSLVRLRELRGRCLTSQLGGAVGSLAFFGTEAAALRESFAKEVELVEPQISWLTSRDRITEFANTLALASAALARIANEVFTLQRAEIGEVHEATTAATVGSITMPHKRNPERSEQIVTLARLIRSQASLLAETMVQEHERDARGWKAEWVALPTMCHYATATTSMTRDLLDGLTVLPDTMLANLHAAGSTSSEQLLRRISPRMGKHAAQAALHDAYVTVRRDGRPLTEVLSSVATDAELQGLDDIDTGMCSEMVGRTVAAAEKRRSNESPTWR